jgi:hypothetical protein
MSGKGKEANPVAILRKDQHQAAKGNESLSKKGGQSSSTKGTHIAKLYSRYSIKILLNFKLIHYL